MVLTEEFIADKNEDFWQDLYQGIWMKTFMVSLTIASTIGIFVVSYSVIEYNQNRHIRTILNFMENSILIYGLSCVALIEGLEMLRIVFGPLPPCICFIQSFWRNGPITASILHLDILIIFRYFYIFVWKNYFGIDEEFFARFCNLLVLILWVLYDIIFMTLPGKMPINYYMCTGQDPDIDPYTSNKVRLQIQTSFWLTFEIHHF